MNIAVPATTIKFDQEVAIALLNNRSYKEIADEHGCSVGKIWAAAVRTGTRKNESRIQSVHEKRRLQASFVEAVINQTVKGDVLDFLSGIPDESVNLTLSSPPYNIGKLYGNGSDSVAPLKYYGWMCQIISELERILRPGGVIALNVGGTRDRDGRIRPLDWVLQSAFKETNLTYQNRIVWVSPHGLTPKRRLSERHETVMIYSKGEPAAFNPDGARTPQKQYDKRQFKGPNKGKASSHPLGAWPSDVWHVKHVGNNHSEKTEHPCQFSENFARRLVHIYSNCGDVVLDPFSGSGTTQAVCLGGRSFLGADLYYEDLRNERLAKQKIPTVCEFPGVTAESSAFWAEELSREREPWRAIAKRVDIPVPTLFDLPKSA